MVLFPVIRFLPKVHCSWRLSGKMINFSQYQSWNMTGNWTIVMNFSQEDFMFLINFHQLVRSLRHQSSQMHSQSALLFLHSLERVLSPPRQWTAMTILSFLLSHTSLFPSHRHTCSGDKQKSCEIQYVYCKNDLTGGKNIFYTNFLKIIQWILVLMRLLLRNFPF